MDRVDLIDMEKGLAYNCEVENRYLSEEIDKCLYKRDVLDMEFNIIVDRLNHLEDDIELNGGRYSHAYYKGISDDIDRLKVIFDKIRYYDMLIDDCKKHIKHNNLLMRKV